MKEIEVWQIKNFNWKTLDCLYWPVRIGDFYLEMNQSEKIINNAKVWVAIYWVNSLKELKNTRRKIKLVIPALTWNAKMFTWWNWGQWDWWANYWWKDGYFLDPTKDDIIIWLDYFWWPYDSSWPDKNDLNFFDVPPNFQVEAWKKALDELWVTWLNKLIWWSNWWWHVHHWVMENDIYSPDQLLSIAWPISPKKLAKEFFKLQADFLQWERWISERLENNVWYLRWRNKLFDFSIDLIKEEIDLSLKYWNTEKALWITRKIWFLKFVNPEYFSRFEMDKIWNKLWKEAQKINLINWLDKQADIFKERFSASSLALLCRWISDTSNISPEYYVQKINKNLNLVILWIEWEVLFDENNLKRYTNRINEIRKSRWHTGTTFYDSIEWNIEWHDTFLIERWANDINAIISKIV